MTYRFAGLLAVLGGLAALGVAYGAQYGLHLVPCPLCLWERWPYRAVIGLGLLAMFLPRHIGRLVLALAILALLAGAGAAFLHIGVEFHWWRSPLPECNGFFGPGDALPAMPAKPCDSPTFLIPGVNISMAAMNFMFAVAFALLLLAYVVRKPRRV